MGGIDEGRVGIDVGRVGIMWGELVGASWHICGASWYKCGASWHKYGASWLGRVGFGANRLAPIQRLVEVFRLQEIEANLAKIGEWHVLICIKCLSLPVEHVAYDLMMSQAGVVEVQPRLSQADVSDDVPAVTQPLLYA